MCDYQDEDEDLEFEIINYFDDEYQEYWRNEIRRAEWDGAEKLYELLLNQAELSENSSENRSEDGNVDSGLSLIKEKFGSECKLCLVTDGESLMSFGFVSSNYYDLSDTRNNICCNNDSEKSELNSCLWISNLFTFPSYRNKGLENFLLDECVEFARDLGRKCICILADESEFIKNRENFSEISSSCGNIVKIDV